MHVFPAEVPPAEAPRADVVEVRVARKVAPLFGVAAEGSPFARTWVCDYTALSLAELGRGAPFPPRTDQLTMDSEQPPANHGDRQSWAWAGRAVWTPGRGPTPGALTNATLNRFGPDTKAAAVLTGANRLLRAPTEAIGAVCRHLAATGCDPEIRLAVWAGLILEVYRAQPALVVAAVQSRLVQRSLSAHWGGQVDPAGVTGDAAPSEIDPAPRVPDTTGDAPAGDPNGASRAPTGPNTSRPTSFDLVDTTLTLLGLAEDTPAGPGLIARDALDDLASAWCHRLLAIGRPGRGLVWLVEDADGSRYAHAMLRVGAVVAPFVAAALGYPPERDTPPILPRLPGVVELAEAPLAQRRAHLLATHVAANYVRYRDELLLAWPQLREQTRDRVADAARRCAEVLDPDDPVTTQIAVYRAYLDVWDRLRTPGAPAQASEWRPAVAGLESAAQTATEAWRSGRLDPGATSYLLEISAVALAAAAAREATRTASDHHIGRSTAATAATTRTRWSAILASRGLDPDVDLASTDAPPSDAQTFHLHHYAAALASDGKRASLRRALALQERVAAVRDEVIRREPARFAAKSAAARAAHELAAAIATDLALVTPDREHEAKAQALRTALRHTHAVLADPSTGELLRCSGACPATHHAARVVARALTLATEHGLDIDPADATEAAALLEAALASHRATGVPAGDDAAELRHWRDGLRTHSSSSTSDTASRQPDRYPSEVR